jgi:hypothetical protein
VTTLLVLLVLAVATAGLALPVLRRRNVLGEVDRFEHARSLTTSWSSTPPPQDRRSND